jgi:LPS-assembly protein
MLESVDSNTGPDPVRFAGPPLPTMSAPRRCLLLPLVVLSAAALADPGTTAETAATVTAPATLPVSIDADRLTGLNDVETVAEGHVELRRADQVLTSDRLTYRSTADEVEATGNVRLSQGADVISGPRLHLKLSTHIGVFENPQYSIQRAASNTPTSALTTGSGQAQRIDFEGKNHYRLSEATYSTCSPVSPDWYARAGSILLDYDTETGEAHHSTIVFQGVPLLYSPWLTFPLNNRRKSGLLAPTIGTTSKSGFEFTLPYYWNIAPNLDATFAPREMTKRGLGLNSEFRYLDHNYSGTLQSEYLPHDQIAGKRRSSYSLAHRQNFGLGFSGSLNLNGVSDDSFFSDLSSRMTNIAQNNLLRQGVIGYAAPWWNLSLMAQSFQTLQDPALPPVAVPYRRLPQLTFNATRADLPLGIASNSAGGSTLNGLLTMRGEFVRFAHPTQVEADRTVLHPQFSIPWQTPAFYLTPRLALHATRYRLSRQAAGVPEQIQRNVPMFSIDSGVTFERPLSLFDQPATQTLEPRLYYLRVPHREQNQIPLFDSSLADFNFAQIFSDNRYSGSDRIGDANQLTVALTTRLIDPASGAEHLRAAIGQRYHFKAQSVTLPGETPRSSDTADFLAALSGQIAPRLTLDAGLQFNPQTERVDRLTLGSRYTPQTGRTLAASYRFNRAQINGSNSDIRQIDLAGQWPLNQNWSAVGRYNYSLADHRLIESVGGLEYNAGCWASRVVLQRMATATGESSTAFFIQLELNGFSNIGSNPLDLLKRSIPGYGRITQPAADPVFAAP